MAKEKDNVGSNNAPTTIEEALNVIKNLTEKLETADVVIKKITSDLELSNAEASSLKGEISELRLKGNETSKLEDELSKALADNEKLASEIEALRKVGKSENVITLLNGKQAKVLAFNISHEGKTHPVHILCEEAGAELLAFVLENNGAGVIELIN